MQVDFGLARAGDATQEVDMEAAQSGDDAARRGDLVVIEDGCFGGGIGGSVLLDVASSDFTGGAGDEQAGFDEFRRGFGAFDPGPVQESADRERELGGGHRGDGSPEFLGGRFEFGRGG